MWNSGLSPRRAWRHGWLLAGVRPFRLEAKINGLIGVERVVHGFGVEVNELFFNYPISKELCLLF